MIVLDTNVLSEPLRPAPDDAVLAWLVKQTNVAITAISVAELLVGARRLPEGARRTALITAIDSILTGAEVLAFDEGAAGVYAQMHETRRDAGRPLAREDGMIAAITATHGASLATRNTADFEGLGIELMNPWPTGFDS